MSGPDPGVVVASGRGGGEEDLTMNFYFESTHLTADLRKQLRAINAQVEELATTIVVLSTSDNDDAVRNLLKHIPPHEALGTFFVQTTDTHVSVFLVSTELAGTKKMLSDVQAAFTGTIQGDGSVLIETSPDKAPALAAALSDFVSKRNFLLQSTQFADWLHK